MTTEEDQALTDRLMQIENLLRNVESRIPDIEGLSVVTKDGLPIASALATPVDEDRISAMTAASLALSERVVAELERGTLDQIMIKGKNGMVIIMEAGEHAVLTGITRSDQRLGLVLLDMRRASEELAALL